MPYQWSFCGGGKVMGGAMIEIKTYDYVKQISQKTLL